MKVGEVMSADIDYSSIFTGTPFHTESISSTVTMTSSDSQALPHSDSGEEEEDLRIQPLKPDRVDIFGGNEDDENNDDPLTSELQSLTANLLLSTRALQKTLSDANKDTDSLLKKTEDSSSKVTALSGRTKEFNKRWAWNLGKWSVLIFVCVSWIVVINVIRIGPKKRSWGMTRGGATERAVQVPSLTAVDIEGMGLREVEGLGEGVERVEEGGDEVEGALEGGIEVEVEVEMEGEVKVVSEANVSEDVMSVSAETVQADPAEPQSIEVHPAPPSPPSTLQLKEADLAILQVRRKRGQEGRSGSRNNIPSIHIPNNLLLVASLLAGGDQHE